MVPVAIHVLELAVPLGKHTWQFRLGKKASQYCHPLDLRFVLFLTFPYYHLISFGCASSRVSLVFVFTFSVFSLLVHLLGLISFLCSHLYGLNDCPSCRSWALSQYQFSGLPNLATFSQFQLPDSPIFDRMPGTSKQHRQTPPNLSK